MAGLQKSSSIERMLNGKMKRPMTGRYGLEKAPPNKNNQLMGGDHQVGSESSLTRKIIAQNKQLKSNNNLVKSSD